MELKIAIVDDEESEAKTLTEQLRMKPFGFTLAIKLYNDTQTSELLNEEADLYFLDIDMPKINGITLAKKLNELSPQALIVFVSKFDNLIFDSQKVNSLGFIRKNNESYDLDLALRKIIPYFKNEKQEITVKTDEIITTLKVKDIIYYEVNGNKLKIFLIDQAVLELYSTIKEMNNQIRNLAFLQISRNCVVNLNYVKKIAKETIILSNDQELYFSKYHRQKICQSYLTFRAGK